MNPFTYLLLKTVCLLCLLAGVSSLSEAQLLPGFKATGIFNEQETTINDRWENVRITINAPMQLNRKGKTYLIFFALPNGNSIEWTKGKKITAGDDWHFTGMMKRCIKIN